MSISTQKLNALKYNLSAKLVDISVCIGRSESDSDDVQQEIEVLDLLIKQAKKALNITPKPFDFSELKPLESGVNMRSVAGKEVAA